MLITRTPIPIPLRPYVEAIRTVEQTSEGTTEIDVYLNGLPGIVFQHQDGYSPLKHITTRIGQAHDIPTLYVYGQTTNPGKMTYKAGRVTTTQIVLKPDALYTLFGVNANRFTNQVVDLKDVLATDLNDQLIASASPAQTVEPLIDFLLQQLDNKSGTDELVRESLNHIHNQATLNVTELIQELHVSERQFERRFKQAVGVSPKFYIRVKRFNQAIRLIQGGAFASLTEVAYHLKYYDQSHFIRDVKAFADISPKRLSGQLDKLHPDQKVFAHHT